MSVIKYQPLHITVKFAISYPILYLIDFRSLYKTEISTISLIKINTSGHPLKGNVVKNYNENSSHNSIILS